MKKLRVCVLIGWVGIALKWIGERVWIWYLMRPIAPPDTAAVGIIGGADGPTAIFITGNWLTKCVESALFIGLLVTWLVMGRKRKAGPKA